MSHRNDDKQSALETLTGSTGHVNNLEKEWLLSVITTPVSAQINDLWMELFTELGATATEFNDAAYEFLTGLGHTGALPDMWAAYWAAGGGTGGTPYAPLMMLYDGSTGYYGSNSETTSGDKFTAVIRYNIASFSGGGAQRFFTVRDSANAIRFTMIAIANDHAATTYRDRVYILIGATNVIISTSTTCDGNDHVAFLEYDGTAPSVKWYIDGVDEDDTGHGDRALNIESLPKGANSRFAIGSSQWDSASFVLNGEAGFIGYADVIGLDPLDFMTLSEPDEQNTTTWLPGWAGVQPLMWNDEGDMHTTNDGSGSTMTKNGTITGPA